MDLSLDRVREVLNLLDNPQDKIRVIQVAGTNGKGSICTTLESILVESFLIEPHVTSKDEPKQAQRTPLKVGKFNSPHLLVVEDSLKINRQNISKEKLSELKIYITGIASSSKIQLTNFELLTVSMYFWFYQNKVDVAIVEVGLGGALDATNVLKDPLVCVFSSISVDHENLLGSTIKEIAKHKAGILKKNSSAVIAQQKFTEAAKVIIEFCSSTESSFIESNAAEILEDSQNTFDGRVVKYVSKNLNICYVARLKLEGDFQLHNLACVLDTIDFLKSKCKNVFDIPIDSVVAGIEKAFWPGRLQWIESPVYGRCLVDGAHNTAAALELSTYVEKYLTQLVRKNLVCIHWVYASTQGKNYAEILNIFLKDQHSTLDNPGSGVSVENHFYLVEFSQPDEMPWIHSTKTETILEFLDSKNKPDIFVECCTDLNAAFSSILEKQKQQSEKEQITVVTGSLYLVADFFRFLDCKY